MYCDLFTAYLSHDFNIDGPVWSGPGHLEEHFAFSNVEDSDFKITPIIQHVEESRCFYLHHSFVARPVKAKEMRINPKAIAAVKRGASMK